MKLKLFLLIILAAALTQQAFAQLSDSENDISGFITELNGKCPIVFGDGWQVNAFDVTPDTISIDITVAPSAEAFISYMAEHTEQVKQMWLQQVQQYGPMWNKLVDLAVSSKRNLSVILKSASGDAQAELVFSPSDFRK